MSCPSIEPSRKPDTFGIFMLASPYTLPAKALQFAALLLVAALALGLAGCGGGGGSSAPNMQPTEMQPPDAPPPETQPPPDMQPPDAQPPAPPPETQPSPDTQPPNRQPPRADPQPREIQLPGWSHTLTPDNLEFSIEDGEITGIRVHPGSHYEEGRVRFSCPASGPFCSVLIRRTGNTFEITNTQGRVTAEFIPPTKASGLVAGGLNAVRADVVPSQDYNVPRAIAYKGSLSDDSMNVQEFESFAVRQYGKVVSDDDHGQVLVLADPQNPGQHKYVFQRDEDKALTTFETDLTLTDRRRGEVDTVDQVIPAALSSLDGFTGVDLSEGTTSVHIWSDLADATHTDWKGFGYWLDTSGDGQLGTFGITGHVWEAGPTGNIRRPDETDFPHLNDLTGTASYEGPAAGLHAKAGAVNLFTATATLTADFDAVERDVTREYPGFKGHVTGRIHSIVSGGEPLSGEILLNNPVGVTGSNVARTHAETGDGRDRRFYAHIEGATAMEEGGSAGFWQALFTGERQTGVPDEQNYPAGIVGTFGATRGAGENMENFMGGFAAGKQ